MYNTYYYLYYRAWEVLSAKHQDAMRQREADRKQQQSSSTAIVSTVASSSCAIVDSSANRAPTTGAAALSASDVSKKVDSQLADPQLTHSEVQLEAHVCS